MIDVTCSLLWVQQLWAEVGPITARTLNIGFAGWRSLLDAEGRIQKEAKGAAKNARKKLVSKVSRCLLERRVGIMEDQVHNWSPLEWDWTVANSGPKSDVWTLEVIHTKSNSLGEFMSLGEAWRGQSGRMSIRFRLASTT